VSVMYIVLPLALLLAAAFVGAFIWAVRHGQMDDLKTPAARMLLDDDQHPARRKTTTPRRSKEHPTDETPSHGERS
jgi:cbb3-type cytochrome oxidase maturation protein